MTDSRMEKIYQAAIRIISEKGFEKASMDEIANASGVAKGTLYYHFKNKEDLFINMVQIGIDELKNRVPGVTAGTSDPVEKIRLLIRSQVEYLRNNKSFCRIMLAEVWGSDDRQRQFRTGLREYITLIEEVLKDGEEKGRLRYIDRHIAAAGIFGAVSISSLHWILNDGEFPDEEVIGTITEMVLGGLSN